MPFLYCIVRICYALQEWFYVDDDPRSPKDNDHMAVSAKHFLIEVLPLYSLNKNHKYVMKSWKEKDGKDGPYNSTDYNLADTANYGYGTGGKQAVDYHPNGYEEVPTAPMSKPPIDDSDDEDEGPLLSQSNTEYHKQRRSNSNLRHSPSRATPDKM